MTADKKIENSNMAYRILVEPWITEAATVLAEKNKYVFKVEKKANKKDIQKAVEEVYKVSVISVRTISIPGKTRTRGAIKGRKSGLKKAIVTLKEGDSINIYEEK